MINYGEYLSKLGIKYKDTPWGWLPKDKRQKEWKQERNKFGFDNRDLWSLNYTLLLLIYPRLKMYQEIAFKIIDGNFHKYKIDSEEYTFIECVNKCLELLETSLKNGKEDIDNGLEEGQEALKILSIILPSLWW